MEEGRQFIKIFSQQQHSRPQPESVKTGQVLGFPQDCGRAEVGAGREVPAYPALTTDEAATGDGGGETCPWSPCGHGQGRAVNPRPSTG